MATPRRAIRFTRDLGGLLLASARGCVTHRATSRAAALAFYTLFSLAPILVLITAVAGFFLGTHAAQREVFRRMDELVGPAAAQAVQKLVAGTQVAGSGRLATLLAALLLGVGATSVFAELKDSLDEIWSLQHPAPAGLLAILRTRLLAFGLVLAMSFLLLTTLVVNAGLLVLAHLWEGLWAGSFWVFGAIFPLFTFLIIASLFGVILKMLPEVRLSWQDVAIGAGCTAFLFSLGEFAIGYYLKNSAVGSTFGAAGSLAALLIWVYYSAQIFFLGAEFTRVYALGFGSLRKD